MSRLRLEKILSYYDGPQVIQARDAIGGHYIGVWVHPDAAGNDYMLVGVAPERLRQLRGGSLDLLTAIRERPASSWWMGSFSSPDPHELEVGELHETEIPEAYLPDEGCFLRDSASGEWLVQEAKEQDSLILALTVEPPESVDGHRMGSESLGNLLLGVQRLIKQAYGRWMRDTKDELRDSRGYAFDVRAFAPGSFQIIMEPVARNNLFHTYEGKPALVILQGLFAHVDDPEKTAEVVSQYRGHLASAYRNLLDIVIAQETRFEMAWADADSREPTRCAMTLTEARNVRTRLVQMKQLTEEEVVLTGVLREADVDTKTWILLTGTGRRSGRTAEDGPSFSEIVLDVDYEFRCNEVLQVTGTGQEKEVLYLTSFQRL